MGNCTPKNHNRHIFDDQGQVTANKLGKRSSLPIMPNIRDNLVDRKKTQAINKGENQTPHEASDQDSKQALNSSCVQINLRRKTGIFRDPSCPIDSEYIEQIDKELGKFSPTLLGVKGEESYEWKKVQMVNSEDEWYYIGEWKNGIMHGVGSAFNKREKFLLSGLFIGGKIAYTNCRKIMESGSHYIGGLNEFYEAEGKGTIHYKDGSKYVGEFIGGLPNGQGKLIENDQSFIGSFENGLKKYGTLNEAGRQYIGSFENNMKHGEGMLVRNGKKIEGEFAHNKLKKMRSADGNIHQLAQDLPLPR